MVLLLGTMAGVLVVGAAAGARHRARHRWVAPYTDVARALRHVTRTESGEFRPTGLVGLHSAPVALSADVVDLRHHRATRAHPAAS